MQDINPIKKTIPVNEDVHSDTEDLRQELGIGETAEEANKTRLNELPNRREQISFSSLYTPESRRNVVDQNFSKYGPKQKNYGTLGKKKSSMWVYGSVFLGLFALIFIYTLFFSSATVNITPVRKNIEVNEKMQLDDTLSSLELFVASSTKSTDVPRRGTIDAKTKASGTIVITNSYDKNPQKLITNTRFESATGKIYRIAESVTVPGMNGSTPGTVEATVYADSIGSEYNTDNTTFTIPGFKGTPRYTKFTAVTKTKISGGASGVQSAVADEDIAKADLKLDEEINSVIDLEITEFKKMNPKSVIVVDSKVTTSSNKNDLITNPKLEYSKTVTKKVYSIPADIVIKSILKNTDDSATVENPESLTYLISENSVEQHSSSTSPTQSIKFLNVSGSASVISNLDEIEIKKALQNKPKSNFFDIMSHFSGIDKAEPKISPFWAWKFPNNLNKIKVVFVK